MFIKVQRTAEMPPPTALKRIFRRGVLPTPPTGMLLVFPYELLELGTSNFTSVCGRGYILGKTPNGVSAVVTFVGCRSFAVRRQPQGRWLSYFKNCLT